MHSLLLILSSRRYFAPAWIFACLNIIIGTWVIYLPLVKEKLALDDGQLGLALLGLSVGMLTAIPFSSTILSRFGLGRTTAFSIVTFGFMMCLPILAPTYPLLIVALVCTGFFSSLTDIGMNAIVSDLEREEKGNFMSACHGFFSLGGVIGGGIGSLVIAWFAQPVYHFLLVAFFILGTTLWLAPNYFGMRSQVADRGEGGKFRFGLIRPLIGLTILSVIVMGSEGSVEHWSKLYFLDVVNVTSDQLAGMIAPVVAAVDGELDFVVLLAGPGVPINEMMIEQHDLIALAMGMPEVVVEREAGTLRAAYHFIKNNTQLGHEEYLKGLYTAVEGQIDSFPAPLRKSITDRRAFAEVYVSQLKSPWMRYFIAFDPRDYLNQLTIPTLAIGGTKDTQVPTVQNLNGISEALARAGNKDVTVVPLLGLNHLFQPAETGAPTEYGTIETTFDPAALTVIGDWLDERF